MTTSMDRIVKNEIQTELIFILPELVKNIAHVGKKNNKPD